MSITDPSARMTAADQVRVPLRAGRSASVDISARVRELLRLTRLDAPDEP